MRCRWCCILEPSWMLSTGADRVMPPHIAVIFLFPVEIWSLLPVSIVQESIEGFEEDPPKVHQSLPLEPISQMKALVPSRILCLPSLNSVALISFPPCCVEEERGEPSPRPLLRLRAPPALLGGERALPVHLIPSLMERALLPMCLGTGVNSVHQGIGFSEFDCIILCFKISLVLLNQ